MPWECSLRLFNGKTTNGCSGRQTDRSQSSVRCADGSGRPQEASSPAPGGAALPPGSAPLPGVGLCPSLGSLLQPQKQALPSQTALVPVKNENPVLQPTCWCVVPGGILAPQCGCREGSVTNDVPSLSRHPSHFPDEESEARSPSRSSGQRWPWTQISPECVSAS